MASVFTTALLGSAVVVGSVLVGTLARDTTPTVKPCVGESCPPKSQKQGVPDQRKIKSSNQDEQVQREHQPFGQDVSPTKKRMGNQQTDGDVVVNAGVQADESRSRIDPNRHERRRSKSTGKVDKGTKTTAVVRIRADKKTNATALITATADKKTNAIAVLNDGADNSKNKKRALWPYERRN